MIGIAVAVGVVITGLVYAGGARRARRSRPGRPFEFTPVWFVSAPGRQSQVLGGLPGLTGAAGRAELVARSAGETPAPHPETGGARDRW